MRHICILIHLLLFLTPIYGELLHFTQLPNLTTWTHAQASCRKHHIDLVTIKGEQENAFFNGSGWIGLYRDNSSSPWKWSREDEIAEFTNWDKDEPKSNNNCVYKSGAKWKTDDCNNVNSFMCNDGLILVKENKTWEEAVDYCRSLGRVDTASSYWNHRYDLASLITSKDHATALNNTQKATTDEVWTGMRFLAGKWLWVGGEQMQYRNLPSCPTNGSCGVFEKSGTASFSTRDCTLRRNFFCYKRP